MRIIIAGGGDIAFQIAERLSVQRDIVVIEQERETASQFESLDVQVVRGNPASIATLRTARLSDADAFVACSESDEQNIIGCLAAKRLGHAQTFCFVSKEEYYNSFGTGDDEDGLLDVDHIIWPQFMLAKEIARIVTVPEAIDVEVFARGKIWLMEYRLDEETSLVGVPLSDLGLPRGVLAVGLLRDEELHIPKGTDAFRAGDKVVFMGRRRPLNKLARRARGDRRAEVGEVTIVGGGTVGLTLAKLLEADHGLRIKLIEVRAGRCERIVNELQSTLVLNGDGTDLELLNEEHIGRSQVLVSVTSDDEKNLLSSLLGRQMKIPKIITRVNKPANMGLFESVGIDVPLNPRLTAIQTVMASLEDTEVQLLATLEHGKARVLELTVPEEFEPIKVRELPRVEGAIIGAILRGRRSIVPHGDDRVRPGDRLLVVATEEAESAVQSYF